MKTTPFPLIAILLLIILSGCREPVIAPDSEKEDNTFVLGDLALERQKELGFTAPPTLEALEALVAERGGWVENALKDDDALVYEYVNGRPPLATVEEARRMENDFPQSPGANDVILSTLCRMPEGGPPSHERDYPEVDYDAKITRHLKADANALNPLQASTMYDQEVLSMLGISFFAFTYDTFESYAPASVNRSWHSSADRLIDKLVIRDDLTWSDGQPVTAHDIEFTYKAIMTSKIPVKGIRGGTDLLVGVKAYDDRTVVFFHEKAMPINVFNMQFSIMPRHIFEKSLPEDPTLTKSEVHREQMKNPVVAGQYVITAREPDFSLDLERREEYYMHNGKQVRAKPFFKKVRFRVSADPASTLMAINSGDIETVELTPEQWSVQTKQARYTEKNTKVTAVGWSYSAFWWNLNNDRTPFFKDIKVRQALYYAMDYETLLTINRHGLDRPCLGVASEDSPWFPKDAGIPDPKQDLGRARQLLDEAGWVDTDDNGIRDKVVPMPRWVTDKKTGEKKEIWEDRKVQLSFTLMARSSPDMIPICQLLETCLREVGIECVTTMLEWNVLITNMQERKFDAAVSGWGAGADPYTLRDVWGTKSTRNNIGYVNPDVDRLFDEGELEFDRQKRMAIYQELHKRIYDDYPCLWLYCRNAYYGFNKDIRGLYFYPRGPIYGGAWKESQATQ